MHHINTKSELPCLLRVEENCRAMLNLVDLAGSERLARSGATGDRLKETQVVYLNHAWGDDCCHTDIKTKPT